MKKVDHYLWLFLLAGLITVVVKFTDSSFQKKPVQERLNPKIVSWGVASGHVLASKVGMDILARGGNAIDASIAMAYTEGVVEPYACGLGGGGVALVYLNTIKKLVVVNFREIAPPLGYRHFHRNSAFLSGVPQFVAGMELMRRKYGSLSRTELLTPAIQIAKEGFMVDKTLEKLIGFYHGSKLSLRRTPDFYQNQLPLRSGDLLIQKSLATQIDEIASRGVEGCLAGPQGESLIKVFKQSGIDFTSRKLQSYHPVISPPEVIAYKNWKLAAPPAPNGGLTFLEMIKMAETTRLSEEIDESTFILKMLNIINCCYHDRFRYLGDNDSNHQFLLEPEYLQQRSREETKVKNEVFTETEEIEESTTHLVAVDRWGNWVSMTLSLGDFLGSGVYVNGYFLNNSLKKFSARSKSPNRYAPGKRSFSYISPCIIFDTQNNQPVLAMGSPGGRQIPGILFQVFMKYFEERKSLQSAIAGPRFYLKDSQTVCFEKFPNTAIFKKLSDNGYQIVINDEPFKYGSVQVLAVAKNGELIGASDPRRQAVYRTEKAWVER